MTKLTVNGDTTIADAYFNGNQIDYIYHKDSGGSTLVWERPRLPSSPTSFSASDDMHEKVRFTWNNPTTGTEPIHYDIYKDGSLAQNSVSSGKIVYNDDVGEVSSYYVRAVNAYGYANSSSDNGVSVQDYSAPTLLTATDGGSGKVSITFTEPSSGYPDWDEIRVYKNSTYSFSFTVSPGVSQPLASGVWAAGTYSVKIQMQGDYDVSSYSNSLNVTIT